MHTRHDNSKWVPGSELWPAISINPVRLDATAKLAVFSGDGSVFLTCDSRSFVQLRSTIDGNPIGPVLFLRNGVANHIDIHPSSNIPYPPDPAENVMGIDLNYDGTVACVTTSHGSYHIFRTPLVIAPESGSREFYNLLDIMPTIQRNATKFNKAMLSHDASIVVQIYRDVQDRIGVWLRGTAPTASLVEGVCRNGDSYKSSAISQNGQYIAAYTTSGEIQLFERSETERGRVAQRILTPPPGPNRESTHSGIAFSPNSRELAWIRSGRIFVWLLSQQHPAGSCPLGMDLMREDIHSSFLYSPNGRYTCVSTPAKLIIVDMASLTVIRIIEIIHQLHNVCDVYFGTESILRLYRDVGFIGCDKFPVSVFHSVSFGGKIEVSPDGAAPYNLTGQLEIPDRATGGGGFGEIYRSSWKIKEKYILPIPDVAVKAMRVGFLQSQQASPGTRIFEREIAVWQMLHHQNIVPFIGITEDLGVLPSMVSEWMSNGTVLQFVESYPAVNRLGLVSGTADGLNFLHSHQPRVIHGDMKAANVLVDQQGKARITDFGISKVLDPNAFWKITTKTNAAGSVPWMSPELLSGSAINPQITTASDVYAFAMTSWEIITGTMPFSTTYSNPGQIVTAVCIRDERPGRPRHEAVSDAVWSAWNQCWSSIPDHRPSMGYMSSTMQNLARNYRPLRVLSIDSSFSRIGAAFVYLRQIFRDIPLGVPIHQFFELISGSGFGGFVAILLGRLRLDIDECLAEVYGLHVLLWKIARGIGVKTDMFAPVVTNTTEVSDHIEEMIIRHGHDPKERFTKFEFDSARVLVYSASNRHTPYPQRGYSTGWEDNPSPALHSVLLDCIDSPQKIAWVNPGLLVLEETRSIFGHQRQLGCFISFGLAQTAGTLNQSDGPGVFQTRLQHCRRTRGDVEDTHRKLSTKIGPSYFRFDFKDYVEREVKSDEWAKVLDYSDWTTFRTVKSMANNYMAQYPQVERAILCADALQWKKTASKNGNVEKEAPQRAHSTEPEASSGGSAFSYLRPDSTRSGKVSSNVIYV